MALESVVLDPGSGGASIAVDTVGSNQVPVSKLLLGADGVDGGLVATANALPVGVWDSSGNELATSSHPLRTDPTGTTAQPITDNGGSLTVDAASLPLPTGAATAAKQPALGIAGTPSADVQSMQGVSGGTALPVSAASLPLPSGAATAAKQPALGTAGSAAADVLTVQGVASMTALKVDGSAVTQPVSAVSLPLPSGAATAAKQPALGTAGSAAVDVLSMQGVSGGVVLPVSDGGGSLTVDGTVIATLDSATQAGATVRTADYDSGAGTVTTAMQGIALPASGGPVAGGTSTNPLRVDPTGTTAQPITDNSGSLTVDNAGTFATQAAQSGTWNVGTVTTVTNVVHVDDNSGALTVDNGGTFATQDSEKIVDNAAFTDGTSKVQPAGYIYDEVAGTALTENDAAAARIDVKRAQVLVLEDATTRGQRASVSSGGALKVDNSAVTQPVSAASLPLPSGASTAAKQPALGTAGSASADVLSVQGVASMTALKVDGSAVTQPVSGTVTVNALPAGTNVIGVAIAPDQTSAIYNGTTSLTPKFAIISAASSGDNIIVAAVTSKKIRVLNYTLVSAGTVNAYWKSATAGALSGAIPLVANSGASPAYSPVGHFETTAGEALDLNLSGAIGVYGHLTYIEV